MQVFQSGHKQPQESILAGQTGDASQSADKGSLSANPHQIAFELDRSLSSLNIGPLETEVNKIISALKSKKSEPITYAEFYRDFINPFHISIVRACL